MVELRHRAEDQHYGFDAAAGLRAESASRDLATLTRAIAYLVSRLRDDRDDLDLVCERRATALTAAFRAKQQKYRVVTARL